MQPSTSSSSLEVDVLRAMLRLARRRTAPTIEAILLRTPPPADADAVKQSLRTLIRADLVHLTPKGPRLTLAGFAVAVAMAATPRQKTAAAAPARASVPMLRRRRAA
jgi:hypothetical protein